MGPLQGVVVLDLSRILAGPWATQVLADFGADVIKIEHPRGGDDTRQWGPPYLRMRRAGRRRESAYYLSTNRGKRSLAIDFSRPEGQELIRRLASGADVLVENFKVGGLERYGLGHEAVRTLNPRLVYLSISAFGQDGPDAAKPGYDAMIQGMGGLMSLTGVPDGDPGAGPQKVGDRGGRPDVRHVRGRRHPRGAARARTLGPGPVHRLVAARHAGRLAREPGHELPGHRPAAAPARARPTRTSSLTRPSRPPTAT